MNYFLKVLTLGRPFKIELTEAEFLNLQNSKKILSEFYSFTENYRIALESYRAVEIAKHNTSLDHMIYSEMSYQGNSEARVKLNVPIVGYLSSSRYFLDATDKLIKHYFNTDQQLAYQLFRSNIYDLSPEYAFVEALRNYVQHRELPIHRVNYHTCMEDKVNLQESDVVVTLSMFANKEVLMNDSKFKHKVLEKMNDSINIMRCIRRHIEGLWQLHDYILTNYFYLVDSARDTVRQAIQRFEKESGGNSVGLYAIAEDSESQTRQEISLLLEWDEARRSIIKGLGNLKNLHIRYISGKEI